MRVVRITGFILVFSLFFSGCDFWKSKKENPSKGHGEETPGDLMEGSIYHLESKWKNQDGKEISLSSFSGKPRVLAMVYTSCQYACPRITSDVLKIQRTLGEKYAGKVGYVLVSFDPERDTPQRLKSYAEKRQLNLKEWDLLTADDDQILELAALLGVKYRKTSDGEFSHSNLISIIDSNGEVVHQQVGLGKDPTESVQKLKEMLR